MLPYLATIVVLVLISRNPTWIRVNMPASLGKPFTQAPDPGRPARRTSTLSHPRFFAFLPGESMNDNNVTQAPPAAVAGWTTLAASWPWWAAARRKRPRRPPSPPRRPPWPPSPSR
jgi:hypothetical protein